MSDPVVINVAGEPVAKGAPRFVSRGGKPTTYTPAKTARYMATLQYAAQQAMEKRPLLIGPVTMSIVVTLPLLQSWSAAKKKQAIAGEIIPVTKPDLDNYAKIVCDALNCVVFPDDRQIAFLTVSKRYGERPGMRIEVAMFGNKTNDVGGNDAGTSLADCRYQGTLVQAASAERKAEAQKDQQVSCISASSSSRRLNAKSLA